MEFNVCYPIEKSMWERTSQHQYEKISSKNWWKLIKSQKIIFPHINYITWLLDVECKWKFQYKYLKTEYKQNKNIYK